MIKTFLRAATALALITSAGFGAAEPPAAKVVIELNRSGATINKNLYGQFAEHLGHGIYGGIWVGADSPIPNTRGMRNDVLAALTALQVPVLRWPGGCFADEYHWMDGIGPKEKRPKMINTHWGGVVEDNSFGTHEFMDLCRTIGADPYVCGNVGSGTVREMMEWVEYMTSDADSPMPNLRRTNGRKDAWALPFFGVGNESWGCGGSMRPEYYADEFRRYNTFVKNYGDTKIYRIACGSNGEDLNWTDVVMKIAGKQMDGLSLHYYTLPTGDWKHKGSATVFGEDQYFSTLQRALHLDELIAKHSAIMDHYDPAKRVGLAVDEWGVWTDAEPGTNPGFLFQQNSLRDAIAAALQLHIFQSHCDRVVMANIAQMVNVLQAMVLTDGPKMVLTPTYHVYEMFKPHKGSVSVPVDLSGPRYEFGSDSIPAVSASASRDAAGKIHLSLVNVDAHRPITVECALAAGPLSLVQGRVLSAAGPTAHNSFERPHEVEPRPLSAASVTADGITVVLPPASISMLEFAATPQQRNSP